MYIPVPAGIGLDKSIPGGTKMRKVCLILALTTVLSMLPLPAGAMELEVAGKSAVLMDAATGTVL